MRHLDLLNVVLSWRFAQPGWPKCLADHGYLVHGVGVTLRLPDRQEICPDVLAGKSATTLLIEVKSGRDVNLAQLRRMESWTPEDLRDYAHLHIPDVVSHKVGIVYVCNEIHAAHLRALCEERATVLGFDGTCLTLGGGPLPDVELASELLSATVDPGAIPLNIVPYDQETPLSEVAEAVLPEVVAALVRGSGQVSTEGIVQKTHIVCHDVMKSTGAGSEQRGVVSRANEVLRMAAEGEFRDWIEPVPRQPIYRFRKALSADKAARTRELKILQKAASDFIARNGGSVQLVLDFEGA